MSRKGGIRTFFATFLIIALLAVVLIDVAIEHSVSRAVDPLYGATFSTKYAWQLGLDSHKAYLAVLDDLGVRDLRIPIYWSDVEKREGQYDFSEIDWLMDEAARRGARVTLVTGLKVPRWPECFVPEWAATRTNDELSRDVFELVEVTVTRYRDHAALARWQVENEPFFPFGDCPPVDAKRVYEEFELVRKLDPHHPIVRTTSGEQSIWLTNAPQADVLGVSLYRVVYNSVQGYWVFPIPPFFYTLQSKTVEPFLDKTIVSELQAEPWLLSMSTETTAGVYANLFDAADLHENARYAVKTGISEIYFWGVEWWYYLKEQGEDGLWEAGKSYF